MSRYCNMAVTITGAARERVEAVKQAAEAEWPFEDWFLDDDGILTASADGNLCSGETEEDFADQAHDKHGVDCLLDAGDGPCECEKPGYFCSGVPGILAHTENGHLAPGAKVERCDVCQQYPSDEAALEILRELGYDPP